ncbi:MAG: cupredoxin domain-containing protein [Methylovirgula sp.]
MNKPLASARTIAMLFGLMIVFVAGAPAHGHEHDSFAVGQPGDPSKPARVVKVTIEEHSDGTMAFSPKALIVKRGEQVRFEITNTGKLTHEFILDTIAHNAHHKIEMAKNPEMEHDDPNMKTLDPGKSAEILWRFSKPGTFEFACLIPGHYEAGMHGAVTVK